MSPTDDFAFHGWAEIYRSSDGEWRYRIKSVNGEIVATPGESYTRKGSAKRALRAVYGRAIEVKVVK